VIITIIPIMDASPPLGLQETLELIHIGVVLGQVGPEPEDHEVLHHANEVDTLSLIVDEVA
jgi:hypothetical protein